MKYSYLVIAERETFRDANFGNRLEPIPVDVLGGV